MSSGRRTHPGFISVTGLKRSWGKISQPAYRDPGKRACPHAHMTSSKILLTKYLRPLRMSPVNQAGPLIGTNFTLGSYEKFQPGCRNEKRPRTSCGAKFVKQSKHGETQSYSFGTYRSFGNSYSCMTAVKWYACDVENTAGKARRCRIHSNNSSRFHPGRRTGLKCSYGKIFQPAYQDSG